jgi:hypothetical protein
MVGDVLIGQDGVSGVGLVMKLVKAVLTLGVAGTFIIDVVALVTFPTVPLLVLVPSTVAQLEVRLASLGESG